MKTSTRNKKKRGIKGMRYLVFENHHQEIERIGELRK